MEYVDYSEKETTAWTDKYKPKKIEDIVGNKKAISMIINWLNNFEISKKQVMDKRKDDLKNKKKGGKKKRIPKVTEKIIEPEQIIDPIIGDVVDILDDTVIEDIEESEKNIIKKKNGPFSCMIATGNHGVGKTCTIHAILNEINYSVQTINFSRIKSNKNIKDIIDRSINNNSTDIMNLMHGN